MLSLSVVRLEYFKPLPYAITANKVFTYHDTRCSFSLDKNELRV